MNWFSVLSHESYKLHHYFKTFSYSKKLVLTALFSALAAILQSTGNFLPGIGYLISPFATLPILICTHYIYSLWASKLRFNVSFTDSDSTWRIFCFPVYNRDSRFRNWNSSFYFKKTNWHHSFYVFIINGWNLFSSIYCPFPRFRTNRQYISFIKGYGIYLHFFFYI